MTQRASRSTERDDQPELSPQEIAYMRLRCAGPDQPSWVAEKAYSRLARHLGVKP